MSKYMTLEKDSLKMSFPQETQHTKCEIEIRFHRTLRIPDDNKKYSLPPSLGHFPLHHVDDYPEKLPSDWKEHGGIFLPMFQAEAMWISFHSTWPFAVKVAAGKINAVSGETWKPQLQSNLLNPQISHDMALRSPEEQAEYMRQYGLMLTNSPQENKEQDYMVVPSQPWLDGFNVGKGVVRQFVAVPLDSGYTVEEQLTGSAEHGGLQIIVYPMKKEEYEKIEKPRVLRSRSLSGGMLYSKGLSLTASAASAPSMGMGAGGFMTQEIYKDKYGFEKWDTSQSQKVFVHLLNSLQYQHITGKQISGYLTPEVYAKYNYPWFEYYSEEKALPGSEKLAQVDSIASLQTKNNENILGDNSSVNISPQQVHVLGKKTIKNGNW